MVLYRVIHQVFDMGWVDLDLNVPIIMPCLFAHSAWLSLVL